MNACPFLMRGRGYWKREPGSWRRTLSVIALLLVGAIVVVAQGTREDYERAAGLRRLTENKVYRDRVQPNWLPGNTQFWYRVKTGADAHQFIFVDAEKGERRVAFDHERLAQALTNAGVKEASASKLPLDQFRYSPIENTLEFRAGGKSWRCELARYELHEQPAAKGPTAVVLPLENAPRRSSRTGEETRLTFLNRTSGEIELFWLDTNGERHSYGKLAPGAQRDQHTYAGHVWLALDLADKTVGVFEADEKGGTAEIGATEATRGAARTESRPRRSNRPVSRDASPDGRWRAFIRDHNLAVRNVASGEEFTLSTDGDAEAGYSERFFWSPDSKKLVAIRTRKAEEHKVYAIESSPKDQVQPKLHSFDYLKPGDRVAVDKPQLFDLAARKHLPVSDALCSNPWSVTDLRWARDSSRFTFLYNQRGHQVLRVVAVDAASGEARALVDEQSDTFINYSGNLFLEYLEESGELIWMSERDGWNHLYLYDARTGQVKNQITRGEWVVRGVERVDREKRQLWLRVSGLRPGQDPYYVHYARVNFDGSGLTVLTQGDGTHTIQYSPDRRFFIDTWSRVDSPPVHELRRSEDGGQVCELERAEWEALLKTGWKAPEPFVAKGRDGVTDIYGVITRPTGFDPRRKYPVIEQIYAGPQGAFVPKRFSSFSRMHELAELGFVVVQIDGMGTAFRSKKFHDICWKNLGDAGFPDRIAWMKAAAARHPWMDLNRVGIYGGSAGGQNALRALLAHGDFYRAAAADCGCHDNRMDKIWWNEQWMGWPVGPHYAEQSNVTQAHQLRGKLLLMVGELDRNVDPASTLQVVNALIKADKDFELIVFPGAGHGAGGSPYGQRRMSDFFVRHLLGVEPRAPAGSGTANLSSRAP